MKWPKRHMLSVANNANLLDLLIQKKAVSINQRLFNFGLEFNYSKITSFSVLILIPFWYVCTIYVPAACEGANCKLP